MHSDVIGCPFQSRVKKWMCVIYQRVCPLKLMENTNLKPWTLKFLYISFILFLCTNPITLHHSPLTLLFSFGGFLGFFFRYLFLLVLFPGITDRSVIACLLLPPAPLLLRTASASALCLPAVSHLSLTSSLMAQITSSRRIQG